MYYVRHMHCLLGQHVVIKAYRASFEQRQLLLTSMKGEKSRGTALRPGHYMQDPPAGRSTPLPSSLGGSSAAARSPET